MKIPNRPSAHESRMPRRSLKEFGKEVGVSALTIAAYMRHANNPPKPVFRLTDKPYTPFFDYMELRTFWDALDRG